MNSVLVIDDERNIRTLVSRVLGQDNIEVHMAGTGKEGLELADQVDPDLALVDLRLPDVDGIQVLRETCAAKHPQTAVIMITAFGHIESVVVAMKNGATDYLEKPFQHLEKLRISVSRALEEVKARREINRLQGLRGGQVPDRRRSSASRRPRGGCARSSPSSPRARPTPSSSRARAAPARSWSPAGCTSRAPGATRPSWRSTAPPSPRRSSRASCSATRRAPSPTPRATKKGLMELADGGTLFLDEVGEIPVASQAKLLRCLQERTFKRVGGTRDIKVDVRVIAATNRSLEVMVKEGKFREDLFYRLNVIPLTIPPAARPARGHPAARPPLPRATPTTRSTRRSSAWRPRPRRCCSPTGGPGNVRELKNLIERLVILSTGDTIEADQLPLPVSGEAESPLPEEVSREPRTLAAVEKAYILKVLRQVNGNKSEAAKILGITRQTLRKKLTEDPS